MHHSDGRDSLLLLQPRRYFLHPSGSVFAQAGAAEVNALAAIFAQVALQGVGVGAFEGEAILPERRLRGTDLRRCFIARTMVAGLRHEPRRAPADLPARVADELFQIVTVEVAGQGARGVSLVGIAFALMPEHRPEAARAKRFHPRAERGENGSCALPPAVSKLPDVPGEGRRIGKPRSLRQPLADTGCSHPAGHHADRDVKPLRHGVTEGRDKTAAAAAGARLRIMGGPPALAVEGRDQAGPGVLLFRPVVGAIRLSRNDEYFADADVLDRRFGQHLGSGKRTDFKTMP